LRIIIWGRPIWLMIVWSRLSSIFLLLCIKIKSWFRNCLKPNYCKSICKLHWLRLSFPRIIMMMPLKC